MDKTVPAEGIVARVEVTLKKKADNGWEYKVIRCTPNGREVLLNVLTNLISVRLNEGWVIAEKREEVKVNALCYSAVRYVG